jgi:hypothetical protein
MLLRGRQGGGLDASCPQRVNDNGPYGIVSGPLLLSSLPPLDKFRVLRLAFRRAEEDKDDDGNSPQGKEER